jgi:hypothetical protein
LRPKIRPKAISLANPKSGSSYPRQSQQKPDLYASAICIKVRSDHLVAGLQLVLRSGGLPYRPETLTKRAECLVRQIYFFFLAVFFFATFFAFFAFLAMSPSQSVSWFNELVQPRIGVHGIKNT